MSAEPILTIGDLEPARPLVAVRRNAPDGPWQRFKHRHFDWLLRWFPVRYAWTERSYELRQPSEFGLAQSARLQRISANVRDLQGKTDAGSLTRMVELLSEFCALVLVAPRDVIDGLDLDQKVRLAVAFQTAVMGRTPTAPQPPENPSTSATSSPASPGSTRATAGGTG